MKPNNQGEELQLLAEAAFVKMKKKDAQAHDADDMQTMSVL